MFGANLRQLAQDHRSISELARQLNINRTQFNRYLAGESFPRPDVLARICDFFGVDARVLLEPVDQIGPTTDPMSTPFLDGYLGARVCEVPEDLFPSGFYQFSRRSFLDPLMFVTAVVMVFRNGTHTNLRGFETKSAMQAQALPDDAQMREYRGLVMRQEGGIALIAGRGNAMTCSFNYLERVASYRNNFWQGYTSRTVPEGAGTLRVTRLVYEYLGPRVGDALPAARRAGFHDGAALLPFHRRLLKPDTPFS